MLLSLVILSAVIMLSPACLCFEVSDRGDCADIMANSLGFTPESGRHHLLVGSGRRSLWVYCDMTTDGGGWTIIQKRTGPDVDFYRNWVSYENGFGSALGDHWLGNAYIHSITIGKRNVLRIEYTDWANKKHYAEYDDFRIGGAGCNYTLESLGKFCGDCGDSLTYHLNSQFSTYDRDNDEDATSCATSFHGAWWYKKCHVSNLNGGYKVGGAHTTFADGINWHSCGGYNYSYKATVMMIRPYDF